MLAVPDGDNHAFFVDAATGGDVSAAYVTRFGNGKWRLAGAGGWVGHHAAGKVALMGSWK